MAIITHEPDPCGEIAPGGVGKGRAGSGSKPDPLNEVLHGTRRTERVQRTGHGLRGDGGLTDDQEVSEQCSGQERAACHHGGEASQVERAKCWNDRASTLVDPSMRPAHSAQIRGSTGPRAKGVVVNTPPTVPPPLRQEPVLQRDGEGH